ncbi:hypothetical protein V6257_07560 [Pseudoalteromonas issachenkonii]|uniref:Glycosyl transferase 64 domain-containing protein n=1 Tax=Pseudoalteromonas issachenkonii TaxID=152297 RepID=A0ABU9GZ50_9GAMM
MWQSIKRSLFARRYLRQQLNHTQQQLALSQLHWLAQQKRLLGAKSESVQIINCIVSLTSYGSRIKTLHYTLYSLLNQTVKPTQIIVWLAHGEQLTKELQALESVIVFKWCKDLRSYKKLIPSLNLQLNAPIITFDDDVIYPDDQVERLYKEHLAYPNVIVCHRAHRIVLNAGQLEAYTRWSFNVSDQLASNLLIPIGIGGVLYPVNCFVAEVTDTNLFMFLCPTADDIWFKFMALKKGYKTKLVENPSPYEEYLHVVGCQEQTLWQHNKIANDAQLAALISYDKTLLDLLRD